METIAFYNQKGGVGKTASAMAVSEILTDRYKKKVLLIDLDAQSNASLFFADINIMAYMQSMLLHIPVDKDQVGLSLEDLLLDPTIDVHKVIRKTKYENLDLIPSFLTLSACENRIQADVRQPQQFRLKQHLIKIADEYDYCILDCSPSISLININGLAMADIVYSPTKADAFSVCGMATVKDLIAAVSSYNPCLKFGGVFFTQWENKRVSKGLMEFLDKNIPSDIIPIKIPKSKLVEEVTVMQKPLYSYDTHDGRAKASPVTQAYIDLTEYIMSH